MASVAVKSVPKTGILSRLPFFASQSKPKFTFEYQFSCTDRAIEDSKALQTLSLANIPSELLNITNELKPQLSNTITQPLSVKFGLIDDALAKSISSMKDNIPEVFSIPPDQPVPDDKKEMKQLYYRLNLSRNYFKSLNQAIKNGTLKPESVEKKLPVLIDSTLIGTSSERVLEHMLLYGPQLHQDTLQTAFYTLFEPEVQTVASILPLYPFQRNQKQTKINNKIASTYLLDKLELNTKTRCVFAWSDPNYTGFKPLADDFLMSTNDLIRGRNSYFPEGDYVAKSYLESIKSKLREEENNHAENRDNMRNGTYFFIVTCLLDWIICTV